MQRRKFLSLLTGGGLSLAALTVVNQGTSSGSGTRQIAPVQSAEVGGATAGGAPEPEVRSETPRAGGRWGALVVYFSRAGENVGVPYLEIGNTAQVAGFIHDAVGGEIFELVPVEDYPEDYDETTEVAARELEEEIHPEYAGEAPRTDRYDTVFIGYPIWWGEQPMIVHNFLRNHDLSHARIIPFSTHEGSGVGNSLDVLGQYYPQADIAEEYSERGSVVHGDPDRARRDVGAWLQRLGF
jgi:flavodoxin